MRSVVSTIAGIAVLLSIAGCGTIVGGGAADPTATVDENATSAMVSACWPEGSAQQGEGDNVTQHQQWDKQPDMAIDTAASYQATLSTNKGDFTIDLHSTDAPVTVNNFVCLANAGYYNDTPFHRIIDGFVIQGGDPTGTGSGGPGYQFQDEPVERDYTKGTVAMANAGPNTNGSQFFVVLDDLTGQLPKNYTIFGEVSDGIDVVESIGKTETTASARGEKSVPVESIVLNSVAIEETAS